MNVFATMGFMETALFALRRKIVSTIQNSVTVMQIVLLLHQDISVFVTKVIFYEFFLLVGSENFTRKGY